MEIEHKIGYYSWLILNIYVGEISNRPYIVKYLLEALKRIVDSNKLKDEGTDIKEVIKTAKEKDVKYNNLKY